MNTYKLQENTLMERLHFHYLENREISAADSRILDRWVTAHALVLDGSDTDRDVAKILMKRFEISNVCASNDIRNSKNFFGDVRASTKKGMQYLVSQWAIDLLQKAKFTNNFNAMAHAILSV